MERRGNTHFTYTLKLDFDIKDFDKVVDILLNRGFVFRQFDLRPIHVIVCSTPHGYHIYMDVESQFKFDAKDICFIQTALGDDFKRCCFNWERVRQIENGKSDFTWNVLFTDREIYEPSLSRYLEDKLRDEIWRSADTSTK